MALMASMTYVDEASHSSPTSPTWLFDFFNTLSHIWKYLCYTWLTSDQYVWYVCSHLVQYGITALERIPDEIGFVPSLAVSLPT